MPNDSNPNGVVPCSDEPATAPGRLAVTFRVEVPPTTDHAAGVHLSGHLRELGAWDGTGVRMRRIAEHAYEVTVRLTRGEEIEYKYTCGSWATVEKGPHGEEVPNRRASVTTNVRISDTVASWARGTHRRSTRTGDIRFHQLKSQILDDERTIAVYLPPDYTEDSARRYAVLYMHDGQNLFDDAASFAGVEWSADETAERLYVAGRIEPVIIVALYNTPHRIDDYTPWPDRQRATGGNADRYARFIVEEVKPFIDREYRTRPERENTGVAGSSLGGLVSLFICQRYPDVFSKCAAVSPAIGWNDRRIIRDIESRPEWLKRTRLWLDMGDHEGAAGPEFSRAIEHTRALADLLKRNGLTPDRDFRYLEVKDGRHNEAAWSARFGQILEFLFPPNPQSPAASAPSSGGKR